MLEVGIIGAGPYGLSVAAHLRRTGVSFRIFGRPMDSWLAHMPKGMMLKSDGFASDIFGPDGAFTLKNYCSEQGIEYADVGIPVSLDTFAAYGLAFRERLVPELEDIQVTQLSRTDGGFLLHLEGGETVAARRIVLAVGITHFQHVPANLENLSPEFLSHSYQHRDLESFRGRRVVVLGGGSSAIDLAGLLHETGADVQLVARRASLSFHGKPKAGGRRPLWQRIRHPQSGLGPGLRSRLYSESPQWFHHLPEGLRLGIVKKHLGPSGGWFAKEMVVGKVPLVLGHGLERFEVQGHRVRLHLRAADGVLREVEADHVIAATGYRADINRLTFVSPDIRSKIKTVDHAPALSSRFESSVPGLYFVGVAAANSFGPVMRFAFGAGFTARHLSKVLAKAHLYDRASVASSNVVTLS